MKVNIHKCFAEEEDRRLSSTCVFSFFVASCRQWRLGCLTLRCKLHRRCVMMSKSRASPTRPLPRRRCPPHHRLPHHHHHHHHHLHHCHRRPHHHNGGDPWEDARRSCLQLVCSPLVGDRCPLLYSHCCFRQQSRSLPSACVADADADGDLFDIFLFLIN